MASILWEEHLDVSAAAAWEALRQVDKAHLLFAGVLVEGKMEGDVRTVTFANGMTVSERIITIDDDCKRIVYTVLGGLFEHHMASMQILAAEDGTCSLVWISDFLPDERGEMVAPLVQAGAQAMASNLPALVGQNP